MGCFFTAASLLRAPSPRPFNSQLYTHMGTRLFPALSLFLAPLLAAQTVPPAGSTAGSAAQQEVLELSPFQVTAEAFKGYYASQTLAGSRLKMNVDEIASSVQIITPEFMQDVGATNLNQLFLFTTSTEASGINGNFSDFNVGTTSTGDQSSRVNPQGSQRVRGIAGADLTRNYFLSLMSSPCRNMFILASDQVVPIASCPNRW